MDEARDGRCRDFAAVAGARAGMARLAALAARGAARVRPAVAAGSAGDFPKKKGRARGTAQV